jgi:hypothetical protein
MRVLKGIGYWLISFTWGILISLVGLIVCLILIITGHKPKRFHYNIYFEVGSNWGGLELGPFFIVNKNPTLHIRQHEAGHGIQNLMFGPIFPFIVSIPSGIRYWYRNWYKKYKYYKTGKQLPSYDSIWFEGMATKLGEKYFKQV